jgi:two-component system chemotaxis sensor kinase CheA
VVAQLTKKLAEAAEKRGAPEAEKSTALKLPPEALSALTEYEEHRLHENLRAQTPIYKLHAPLPLASFEKDLADATSVLNELGEVITTLPSTDESGKLIIFDIVFASTAGENSVRARVSKLAGGAYGLERVDAAASKETTQPRPASDTQLPSAAAAAAAVDDEGAATLRQVADTVRVDIRKLDELMGIVGELVLARGGLSRVTAELKAETGYRGLAVDLHRLVRTLERRIVDLQTAIMQVRMVPLGQVFERLARTVRRTASQLGKEVELEVHGEETELDKLIVEDLVDPLMHLVRNAVDHGIEPTDARLAAGKTAAGKLELRAYPRGNHVIIDVVDDGRGIDEVAVKRTALERGIVDDEHIGQLSRRDVWNLVFAPGFSTRKEVSETSGRGVGLDVVKTNVARLSGLIDVESVPGRGTKFSITLPITLAIIQAVIVRSARRVYALPLASVLEIVAVQANDLCRVEGKEMLQLRGQTLPVLRLDRVFHADELRARANETRADDTLGYAAVVGLAQHRAALVVDDVLGQQDIVIKSLGAYLANVKGIAGATHLGDHETILVLDVASLVQELLQNERAQAGVA